MALISQQRETNKPNPNPPMLLQSVVDRQNLLKREKRKNLEMATNTYSLTIPTLDEEVNKSNLQRSLNESAILDAGVKHLFR